jgi:Mn2+/Fe2+ NRAMP family transporter
MGKVLEIFLGILTSMGGFVEVGELTFALNAGVHFHYAILWVTALGTIGIIVYCEMAGRVAAVRKQPVFNLIRERAGFGAGLVTLVAANVVNLLTCAAEIGGVALIWQLLGAWPYRLLIVLALVLLLLCVWVLSFEWIERVFGLGGLLLVVFMVVAWREGPDWGRVAAGFVPSLEPARDAANPWLYPYYVVALFSSILLPYETYFYASGAIEDQWKPDDIPLNRAIVGIGFTLGALLSVALVMVGAQHFADARAEPQLPGLAALAAAEQFGVAGALIAIGGMFFAFGGAAIETALCGAYNLAQFLGWPWGKVKRPRETGRFTLSWIVIFVLAAAIVLTGVDPVEVVEYSIVFSVIILPFTYFPLLVIAGDVRVLGEHANGRVANVLGWIFLVLVCIAALAAIPLLIATHGGKG